ncbi:MULTISPECIES: protein kinase domain-containing protein [Streptomyces]|uniref:protein kinase domain-containing protein n=1 Tax=Streptomyces TaxID=1883 RepID=UPI0009A0066F|nr:MULTISPECIES: protein kinase [Streptomyces]MBZ6110746.1 protein kinase [Streptomyces olivaceus]MBZ6123235.1 protein kinase [Streptomyces olivaceus]MBZ6146691.1 protein kinase [Streptomyces olivaceus]MBZ6158513.1 protein kinase [Streptomyces olivaceus]MBZ6186812.1 protein kinase [Streptomyces olivaceus]
MAQQQRAQGPSEPEASGGGMSDAPENWGNGGLVGDGRYRLTRRLGRGGMAEVFAAEDVRLGRTVAVKLLRADLAEDPVSKARFTREAQSVAGLNHHAIVAVYDSGEDVAGGQSVPYIVMEIVEGRTIRDLLLNAEAPGPEQALIIVSGVLEALAYSHQHGIVHRDIKPANVIITNAGAVKVMDFGIARALHGAQSTMTQTGMVMGTPQYLSPEQALGKAVDHRSDLYATGCLLYELLALRPPFTGETPLSVVYQHVQDIPTPPSEVSDATPPELDGLVMRSLAKEPDDRFQTAEEMRGLVQYGLQMLYEQGGHTGTWNTGPVAAHDGRHTPAAGLAGTTALPHPGHGASGTQQIPQPILPGRYGGDDGGFEGGGNRGSGRGKLWILAVLAVIAVAAGVALALNNSGDGKGDGDSDKSPSATTSQSTGTESPSSSPSDEATEETTDPGTEQGSGGAGTGGDWDPSWTPSYTPSHSQTQGPTNEPTGGETEPTAPPEETSGGGETDPGGGGESPPGDGETAPGGSTEGQGGATGDTGNE